MKWRDRTPILSDEISRLKSLSPYELLKVRRDASMEEIKRAYRKLVKTYHPDRASPFMRAYNQEILKLLNAAYDKIISYRGCNKK